MFNGVDVRARSSCMKVCVISNRILSCESAPIPPLLYLSPLFLSALHLNRLYKVSTAAPLLGRNSHSVWRYLEATLDICGVTFSREVTLGSISRSSEERISSRGLFKNTKVIRLIVRHIPRIVCIICLQKILHKTRGQRHTGFAKRTFPYFCTWRPKWNIKRINAIVLTSRIYTVAL